VAGAQEVAPRALNRKDRDENSETINLGVFH